MPCPHLLLHSLQLLQALRFLWKFQLRHPSTLWRTGEGFPPYQMVLETLQLHRRVVDVLPDLRHVLRGIVPGLDLCWLRYEEKCLGSGNQRENLHGNLLENLDLALPVLGNFQVRFRGGNLEESRHSAVERIPLENEVQGKVES